MRPWLGLLLLAAHAAAKPAPKPKPCADVEACQARCEQGHAPSCTRAADLLEIADSEAETVQAAYERGCSAGDARACVRQAHALYGQSDEDTARARALLEKACAAKDGQACFNLVEVLEDTGGDAKAVAKAQGRVLKLLEAKCKRADFRACAMLGRLYKDGFAPARKDAARAARMRKRALALMTKECKAGDPIACHELEDERGE